jgi:murein L,D-transpeptidase YafK
MMGSTTNVADSFKSEQLQYSRVRTAYAEKEDAATALLTEKGIDRESMKIYIRALKLSEVMQVWVTDKNSAEYQLLVEYKFCTNSGKLGPKRKQGDYQIPEGFYHVDRFNPHSAFYLSLGINYPNNSDRKLSPHSNLGGDIFLHGDCVSIGCIPITDEKIKELYFFAVEAKNNGQSKIPVHIFPWEMTEKNLQWLKVIFPGEDKMHKLWDNLKEGYDYFEANRKLPNVSIGSDGYYRFS